MPRLDSPAHAILSTGRWLLPWLIVLVVSTSIALATSTTTSRSRVAALVEDPAEWTPGPSCTSLFGSYNAWLFSGSGSGVCGLDRNVAQASPADR